MRALSELYQDTDGAICRAFFPNDENSPKLWDHLTLLSEADDVTFWTVMAWHRSMPRVIEHAVVAIDRVHSSASSSKDRLTPDDEMAFVVVVMRLLTSSPSTRLNGREEVVDPVSMANCLSKLLPQHTLMPLSLVLQRHSGVAAAVCLTSLFLQAPCCLRGVRIAVDAWCNTVRNIATRCVRETQRGRFQRLPGDVLGLFEHTYRQTKHLWALVHSAPFVCDYINTLRVLQALRVLTDLVAPLLQHFVISSDALAPRRVQLSRVGSVILNAAVNSASTVVLFASYAAMPNGHRAFCVERIVCAAYDSLASYMVQYVRGTPSALLSSMSGSMKLLFHELQPPAPDFPDQAAIGKVLLSLMDPIPDSKDFSDGLLNARQRFFPLLLMELVRQGMHIDRLLKSGLLSASEAKQLGASEVSITQGLAGITSDEVGGVNGSASTADFMAQESAAALPAALPVSAPSYSPAIQMVLDVMPDFSVSGIEAALRYYNDDVEQFIIAAAEENLPPHLVTTLQQLPPQSAPNTAACPAQTAGATATPLTLLKSSCPAPTGPVFAASNLSTTDFDDEYEGRDIHLFISRDLYDAINGDNDNAGAAGCAMGQSSPPGALENYVTLDHFGYGAGDAATGEATGGGLFEIDEDMKERIRVLMEMMYEDEHDDSQDGPNYSGGARQPLEEDDGEGKRRVALRQQASEGGEASGDGATEQSVQAAQRKPPRDAYHDKRYQVEREKRREARVKELQILRAAGATAGAGEEKSRDGSTTVAGPPAYAGKKKSTVKKASAGGGKNATARLLRKGRMDS